MKTDLTILSQLFYPELVSTGQTLTEIAEQWSELGINLKVISGPPTILKEKAKKKLIYKNIKIERVWGTQFNKISFWGKLANQVSFTLSIFFKLAFSRDTSPILVLTNPPFLALIPAILAPIKKRPIYFLVFDIYPDTAIICGLIKKNSLIAKLWMSANAFIFKKATLILSIGRCMTDRLKATIPTDAHAKIHTLPIWGDNTQIQSCIGHNPFPERWKLKNKFITVYSGNFGRFHDIESILKTAQDLKESHPDILFLFVGEGAKKKLIENAIQKGATNIQLHTYVAREELGYLLKSADVGLVSLSDGHEGLSVPSKTFAIMAAGIPIIGLLPKSSEIALVLTESESGIVVPPHSPAKFKAALLSLYEDRQTQKLLGKNGANTVQCSYQIQDIAKRYLKVMNLGEKV